MNCNGKVENWFTWVKNKSLRQGMLRDFTWLCEDEKRYYEFIDCFLDEFHEQLISENVPKVIRLTEKDF